MIEMTLREIAAVVGGRLVDVPDPDRVVTGSVHFDSRRIGAGDLFLALPGQRVDGHDYVPNALDAGAVAALTTRPVGAPAIVVPPAPGTLPAGSSVFADDPDGAGAGVLRAVGKLAQVSVARLVDAGTLTVVGVTGSSGKTSTKDLLAAVLRPLGPVVAPPGSFNNELGLPFTALQADAHTRFLVLEYSARGRGHIAALTEVITPRFGVVLNVGTAHLGEFGSRDAIAEAKGELVAALPPTGVAVLNADDPRVAAMTSRTAARVVTVGQTPTAQVRATDVVLDEEVRARFVLHLPGGAVPVALAVHGEHHVGNALAAAAVAHECGASPEQVAAALSEAQAVSARRMAVRTRSDGVTIIDDSYNANPDSMQAALQALASMSRAPATPRRSWAVLGQMGELGDEAIVEHDRIGRRVVRLAIDRLVVVGEDRPSRALYRGAVLEGSWGEEAVSVPDVDTALRVLQAELAPDDLVLVKASQVQGLWRVAEGLLAADAGRATAEAAQ